MTEEFIDNSKTVSRGGANAAILQGASQEESENKEIDQLRILQHKTKLPNGSVLC